MNPILAEDVQYIAKQLNAETEVLKNSSIFITGGTGYFGKNILEAIMHLNAEQKLNVKLFILTRNKQRFLDQHPRFNHPNFVYIENDVAEFVFPNEPLHYIIHGAAEVAKLDKTDELDVLETAYFGTKKLLELAKEKKVKGFLFMSSGAIYGNQPFDLPAIPESYGGGPDITKLNASYGEGKRMGEYLCQYYGQKFNVPVKIGRCFAFVGPYMPLNAQFAFGNFIQNAMHDETISMQSDGSSLRTFLYTADLVCWFFKLLLNGKNMVPYNIGGATKEISILEIAQYVSQSFDNKIKIEVLQKEKSANRGRYIADVSAIMKDLNITSVIGLEESLDRTVKYYKFEFANQPKQKS